MTTWIKSHDALRDHPKLKRLCRLAAIDKPTAIGYLHMFWWWCMKYAPDGDLSRFDDEDIDDGVEWSGEFSFITLAIAAKFVDSDRTVHDWSDYGEALLRRREANAERMRNARAEHVQNTCEPRVGLEKSRGEKIEKRKDLAAKTAATKPGSTEVGKPAQRIVAHYVDCHQRQGRTKPDNRLIGKMAKAAKERLDAGASERTVMAAVELLVEKAFDPTTLANFVSQVEREGWKPDPEAEAAYLSQRIAGVVG